MLLFYNQYCKLWWDETHFLILFVLIWKYALVHLSLITSQLGPFLEAFKWNFLHLEKLCNFRENLSLGNLFLKFLLFSLNSPLCAARTESSQSIVNRQSFQHTKHLFYHHMVFHLIVQDLYRPNTQLRFFLKNHWRSNNQNQQFLDNSKLFGVYIIKENILWLNISMDDFFMMHIIERWTKLPDQFPCFRLCPFFLIIDESPIMHIFHNQIYFFFIIKIPIQRSNMLMTKIWLNFNFPDYMFLKFIFLDFLFR